MKTPLAPIPDRARDIVWAEEFMAGDGRWANLLCGLCLLLTVALILCPAVTGIVHHHILVIDTVAWLDASWRIAQGQVANRDFFVQVGPLPFALTAAVMRTVTANANALAIANSLVGALVALGGFLSFPRRYGPVVAAILTTALTAIATSPHLLDEAADVTSYAMLYNRWGWALAGLVIATSLVSPRAMTSKRFGADAGVAGFALALLAFIKPNFFVAAVCTVTLALIAAPRGERRWHVQTLLTALLAGGVLSALLPYDLSGYIATLRTAARLRSAGSGLLATQIFQSNVELLLILAGIAFLGGNHRAKPSWTIVVLVLLPCLLISLGNSHESGRWPLVFVAGFACTEIAGRWARADHPAEGVRIAAMLISALVLGIHCAVPDVYATARATGWYVRHDSDSEPRIDSATYRPLLLPVAPGESPPEGSLRRPGRTYGLSPQEYAWTCNDALALLRRNQADQGRILCLDTVNPFPYATQSSPPRGDILTWHPHHSFDQQHAPAGATWAADATDVLEPLFPFDPEAVALKASLYRAILDRDFVLVDQSSGWRLYRRGKAPSAE